MAILGRAGKDIFEYPGVMGDLREDCEDMEVCSAMLDEFFRESPEVMEPFLPLRVKRPILAAAGEL